MNAIAKQFADDLRAGAPVPTEAYDLPVHRRAERAHYIRNLNAALSAVEREGVVVETRLAAGNRRVWRRVN